jgi:hypothetical protein
LVAFGLVIGYYLEIHLIRRQSFRAAKVQSLDSF